MADYFHDRRWQTIPVTDMTLLERLLLSPVFDAGPDNAGLYFHASDHPADFWTAE